jgi:DNA-binding GntR family transcriptional regulator
MTAIVPRSLPEVIYQDVRERILSGRLAPGQPVRQDALALDLGVSKIPLREALTRLEQDGLVTANPRRGYEVKSMTAGEAEEIFDLRLSVEPAAAALAARNADDADRAAVRAALEALDAELDADGPNVSALNRAFHLAMVAPARRPLTTALVDRLHTLAERYVRAHLQPEGRSSRARREHADLLSAWCDGRSDEVEADLSEHILATLRDLQGQFG